MVEGGDLERGIVEHRHKEWDKKEMGGIHKEMEGEG